MRFNCDVQFMGYSDNDIVAGFQEVGDRVLFDNKFSSVAEAQEAVDAECWEWLVESGLKACYSTESPVIYEEREE